MIIRLIAVAAQLSSVLGDARALRRRLHKRYGWMPE